MKAKIGTWTTLAALWLAAPLMAAPLPTLDGTPPLVIGHRGASAERPEHTLASYLRAIEVGADFVEPDLVMTKDNHLVTRHEPEIGLTTDAPAKFPDRKRTAMIDGKPVEGWFAEDFTLAELKTLRAIQPHPDRSKEYDGQFEIPTLQEVIDLVRAEEKKRGRTIGIYPETKHPTYFAQMGKDMNTVLLDILRRNYFHHSSDAVFIQSFEISNLKDLSKRSKHKLIQLLGNESSTPYDQIINGSKKTYRDMMNPDGLAEIAKYAYGIGPSKTSIIPIDKDGRTMPRSSLVGWAHKAGLRVYPYTFRSEPRHLPAEYRNDLTEEMKRFFALGVDGIFTDEPATGVKARAEMGK
ncbi:glycerophosphodiester phosphodiesterase [Lacibacterium aquatile]|uniref:glycerophosphodiester phosphodiesterase n=1 Tax=Lacibacterium aquatile TaxID=1168082 RepID=A0ABW5DS89_9PROT